MRSLGFFILLACSCDSQPVMEAWAATPPSFDCGRLAPEIGVECGARVKTDTAERVLASGETSVVEVGFGGHHDDMPCAPAESGANDPGRQTQAVLHATCSATTPSADEDARWQIELKAMASRVCVSTAYVRVEWSGSVTVPEGRHLVSLDATATRNLGAADAEDCIGYVGEERVDPISPSRKNVFLRAIDGPAAVPLRLDCNGSQGGIARGLEGASCTSAGIVDLNSSPTSMTDLTLEVGVARLP